MVVNLPSAIIKNNSNLIYTICFTLHTQMLFLFIFVVVSRKKQLSMSEFVKRRNPPCTPQQAAAITDAILFMLVTDNAANVNGGR